jgi:hypothetical protein
MKYILFVIMTLIFLVACQNHSATNQNTETSHEHFRPRETDATTIPIAPIAKPDSNHVHIYACPMHPEVTGKESDKCPKCGMALEYTQ